jgi:hypothetical protein
MSPANKPNLSLIAIWTQPGGIGANYW